MFVVSGLNDVSPLSPSGDFSGFDLSLQGKIKDVNRDKAAQMSKSS